METFEDVKKKLFNSAKGTRISVLSESDVMKQGSYINTNAYDLNRILSGSLYKGVVSKTLTFMVGPEASGKSSFMALNLAAAQKMGYTPLIIDTEIAWSHEFCKRWGIDIEKAFVLPWSRIDEIEVELSRIINSDVRNLAIALDSIGALFKGKVISDGVAGDVKADQGGLQKEIKVLMKILVQIVKLQDSVGFMSGHYYGSPSMYGSGDEIGGGKYPKLASDYIITLKKGNMYENPAGKTIADKGRIIGTEIKAATLKNRIHPPFQEAKVAINYQTGIDPMAGILERAEDMGLIQTSGSWVSCDILDLKVQGRANFMEELNKIDNKPLLNAMEKILEDSGYSTTDTQLENLMDEESSEAPMVEEVVKKKTTKKKK